MILLKADLDKLHQAMKKRIEEYGKVSIIIEDQYGNGISFKAFIKDFAFEISNNTNIQKIAIITDEEWFRGYQKSNPLLQKQIFSLLKRAIKSKP